jgi:hypothetical protein
MKNQLLALIGLGLLMATASAYAQTVVVKANVPFDFIVGKTTLPAGEYTLQSRGADQKAMTIQSSDTTKIVLPNSCVATPAPDHSKLIFHRYGDQYFLVQIWTAGNERGQELPRNPRETELAQDHSVQNVVLAAVLR